MAENKNIFEYCDELVDQFEKVIEKPILEKSKIYYTGVDLGTACVVLAVLDENKRPVAGAYRYADVVKDGMVVDYIGAIRIVRELKNEIEEKLGEELLYAAAAFVAMSVITVALIYIIDCVKPLRFLVQAAGFELTNLLDEPTAANEVLKIQNGAVVDIGGGTTGTSIIKDGKVVYVADEPTGGTHFSLVVAGAYGINFDDADKFKRNKKNHKELLPILKPVIEKVGSIINIHVKDHYVKEISLVGGTACLEGIEEVIEKQTKIYTYKPKNPMFVTPLGIALSCTDKIID